MKEYTKEDMFNFAQIVSKCEEEKLELTYEQLLVMYDIEKNNDVKQPVSDSQNSHLLYSDWLKKYFEKVNSLAYRDKLNNVIYDEQDLVKRYQRTFV